MLSCKYKSLKKLQDTLVKEVKETYNLNGLFSIMKYFDNSIFELIKEFTPVNKNLTSGVLIKEHKFERNKYPTPKT